MEPKLSRHQKHQKLTLTVSGNLTIFRGVTVLKKFGLEEAEV